MGELHNFTILAFSNNDSPNRVALSISTARVILAPAVPVWNIYVCLLKLAGDLDILRGRYHVRALDRVLGYKTRAVTCMSAVCYAISLGVTNRAIRRRSPETEVVKGVDPCGWPKMRKFDRSRVRRQPSYSGTWSLCCPRLCLDSRCGQTGLLQSDEVDAEDQIW